MKRIDERIEKKIVAAGLQNPGVRAQYSRVQPGAFASQACRVVWNAMQEMDSEGTTVDLITLSRKLELAGALDAAGGQDTLEFLATEYPGDTDTYMDYLIDANQYRQTEILLKRLLGTEGMTGADMVAALQTGLMDLADTAATRDGVSAGDVAEQLLADLGKPAPELNGVPTGLKDLDERLDGLHKADLIILAARPAMGKTALALTVALNAAVKSGASVMFFSLEMPKEQLTQRLLSMDADIELQDIRRRRVAPEALEPSVRRLKRARLQIDDTTCTTVSEMKNKALRRKAEAGLDLVIIDYLQLMEPEGRRSESRNQDITIISRRLKLMAKELDCPVIVLSQLSRAPETRNEHRPMLSDLRESGSIEQDADIVLFPYRESVYIDDQPDDEAELIIAKHRNGPTGMVKVAWLAWSTRFVNLADISQYKGGASV